MKIRYIFLIGLLTLVFYSCIKDKQVNIDESFYEEFVFKCYEDTVLTTKNGVSITIESNSFDCKDDDAEIKLKILPILNKSDLIKYQAYTIDRNGNILESGGMFNIDFFSLSDFEVDRGVKIGIPSDYLDERMKVFKSDGDEPIWELTDQTLSMPKIERLQKGEALFTKYCATCHSKNLRQDMTGPALGNVNEYRDLEWLIRYTKSSQQMILAGDSIAICIWNEWKPVVMNNFQNLDAQEITDIYSFISNESKKQRIQIDEVNYPVDCDYESIVLKMQDIPLGPLDSLYSGVDSTFNYILEVNSSGWYNVDYFLDFDGEVDNIIVDISGEKAQETVLVLVFKNRNVVIPFDRDNSNRYVLRNSIGKKRINFPQEIVQLIGYSIDTETNEIVEYVIEDYKVKAYNNNPTLDLEPIGDKDFFQMIN